MKNIIRFSIVIGFIGLFWFGRSMWFADADVSRAQQTSDSDYQKLLERDKNVSKEKVDQAFAEAKKIQDDILAIVAEKKPEFTLSDKRSRHLLYDSPGQRGETHNEITWRTTKTQISINITLGLRKENQLPSFRQRLDTISMGEFFAVPNIGDEAILVKNVSFNTKTTSVGLHFVKGRAQVNIYVTNYKRKTATNEKELMEVVNLIEL